MPFDVSVVPNDIWYEIASFLEVKDIISLEDTCIFIREIFSDRIFWLKHLHALDQDHAPDLPRHIPLTDLTWSDLRNLVVRAQRQSLNCTGPTPLQATRETTVPVGSANSDGVLGRLYGSGTDVALLPGGSLLLVCWSAGYLQCWDVPGRECLWTHMPEASLGEPDTQPLRVCSFGYDMQANGEVRVLVVSESADNDPSLNTFEIFQIFPPTKAPISRYKRTQKELDIRHGSVTFSKLCGDVLVVNSESCLSLTFWKEDRSVVIVKSTFDDIDIVDDYLICVQHESEGKSVVAVLLSAVREIQPSTARALRLTLDALPYTRCPILQHQHWRYNGAFLSICNFHWKPAAERNGIAITVLLDVYSVETTHDFYVADSFLLDVAADTASTGMSVTSLPDAGRPCLTPLRRLQSIALDGYPSMYGLTSSPSQAGVTGLMLCKEAQPELCEIAEILAIVSSEKEVVFHALDVPRAANLRVEFYSGAIYFPTLDSTSIVIQYFD